MRKSIAVQFLLDVNVLVAMTLPDHPVHPKVHRWFQQTSDRRWATCPLTQGGFLRVATYLLGGSRQHMATAITCLENCRLNPHHEFWPVDVDINDCDASLKGRILGPNQITDLQLLLLAHKHRAQLATLDKGLGVLARGTQYAKSLLVI